MNSLWEKEFSRFNRSIRHWNHRNMSVFSDMGMTSTGVASFLGWSFNLKLEKDGGCKFKANKI